MPLLAGYEARTMGRVAESTGEFLALMIQEAGSHGGE